MASFKNLRVLYVICLLWPTTNAQTCYYPNGNVASGERACSSASGSACCPNSWACLDNGLCYYEPDDLYGRYSCTDKSWKSPGCPSNMCVYDVSRGGGEAITQCSNHNNQWCCDGDRTNVDCCNGKPSPRAFFNLAAGNQYALIGSSTASSTVTLATISGPVSDGSTPSTAVSSSRATTTSSAITRTSTSLGTPSIISSAAQVTSLQTEVSSGSGGPITVVRTVTAPATSSTSEPVAGATSGSSSSKVGLIVGCAVGIPLGLCFLAILFLFLRKRSQHKAQKNAQLSPPHDPWDPSNRLSGSSKPIDEKASRFTDDATLPDVPELPGQTIGPERPISLLQGKAELEAGTGFTPGTFAHSPHLVGIGGGAGNNVNNNGSLSPGYPSTPNTPHTPAANSDFSSHMRNASATSMQKPLLDAAGNPQYIAYRPPPGHEGHEVAELSAAATTPPAVVEAKR